MAETTQRGPLGFRIIGVFKFLSSLVLFAVAIGVLRLVGRDLADAVDRAARAIKLDPNNDHIHGAIGAISGLTPSQLKAISAGTFFYAVLYMTEGLGLFFEKTWAGYLTVVATGSLIPLEIYEVWHKPNALKVAVLTINVAIVIYLVVKLIQERRAAAAKGTTA